MKRLVILGLALSALWGCQSKEKQEVPEAAGSEASAQKEVPEGQWEVHRDYDDQGNLIRYDSVFRWSSSDHGGLLSKAQVDSLFRYQMPGNGYMYGDQVLDSLHREMMSRMWMIHGEQGPQMFDSIFHHFSGMQLRMERMHDRMMGHYHHRDRDSV